MQLGEERGYAFSQCCRPSPASEHFLLVVLAGSDFRLEANPETNKSFQRGVGTTTDGVRNSCEECSVALSASQQNYFVDPCRHFNFRRGKTKHCSNRMYENFFHQSCRYQETEQPILKKEHLCNDFTFNCAVTFCQSSFFIVSLGNMFFGLPADQKNLAWPAPVFSYQKAGLQQ